ncbi:MAG: hypothetical protein DHS20C15_19860 [Planctomycetota bacterium]|nr:MAG: hypothetical protein DHS20C15_19860 [Planctomycetota bacterium]
MSRRAQAGFTLTELLIVATLTSLLSILLMQLFGPVAKNTSNLRAQALAVSELRAGTEALLQDLGGVEHAEVADGALLLQREEAVARFRGAWRNGGDAGILYSFEGGDLRRADLALGGSVVVARGLSAFDLTVVSSREVEITLAAESGGDTPSILLRWDESGGGL